VASRCREGSEGLDGFLAEQVKREVVDLEVD
jgi:hypothetical protein